MQGMCCALWYLLLAELLPLLYLMLVELIFGLFLLVLMSLAVFGLLLLLSLICLLCCFNLDYSYAGIWYLLCATPINLGWLDPSTVDPLFFGCTSLWYHLTTCYTGFCWPLGYWLWTRSLFPPCVLFCFTSTTHVLSWGLFVNCFLLSLWVTLEIWSVLFLGITFWYLPIYACCLVGTVPVIWVSNVA
jgi:hypothetical protein